MRRSNTTDKQYQSRVRTLSVDSVIGKYVTAMALVLAHAAPLKPEINLTRALHDYETILLNEDRRQLYSHGLPDAEAAIKLTTLIDNNCNSRRRHCMGPRLITFLESIQQFSRVTDTFISSHPEIAALVWGGVKLTLLVRLVFEP